MPKHTKNMSVFCFRAARISNFERVCFLDFGPLGCLLGGPIPNHPHVKKCPFFLLLGRLNFKLRPVIMFSRIGLGVMEIVIHNLELHPP